MHCKIYGSVFESWDSTRDLHLASGLKALLTYGVATSADFNRLAGTLS